MIRAVFISGAFVLVSGGIGFGFSSLHSVSFTDAPTIETASLAAPASVSTHSGFVIPDFVPTQPAIEEAVLVMPETVETADVVDESLKPEGWIAAAVSLRPKARTQEAYAAWLTARETRLATLKAEDADTLKAPATKDPIVARAPRMSRDDVQVVTVSTKEATGTVRANGRISPRQPAYLIGVYR